MHVFKVIAELICIFNAIFKKKKLENIPSVFIIYNRNDCSHINEGEKIIN